MLTHWGRGTHICVVKLTIIGSDNGVSPGRRQAIIWTNAGILLIGPLGTNFIEILIGIQTFSCKKMHLKMSSAKWRPFCLGLNVLIRCCSKGVDKDSNATFINHDDVIKWKHFSRYWLFESLLFNMQNIMFVCIRLRSMARMMLEHRNALRIIGPLWLESTGDRWISLAKDP